MSYLSVLSGRLPNELANAVSDAINAAIAKGMGIDEATSVAIGVAADYARAEYGNNFLGDLAKVVTARAGRPLPGGSA